MKRKRKKRRKEKKRSEEKKYCPDSNSGLSVYRANALPLDNVVDSLTSYSRMLIDYFSLQAIFQVINFITVTQTNSVIHGQSVSLTSVFVRAGIMEMENIAVKVQNYMVPSFTHPLSERARETLDQMVKGRNEDAP